MRKGNQLIVFLFSLVAMVSRVNAVDMEKIVSLDGKWLFRIDPAGIGREEAWYARGGDRSAWEKVDVPGYWERHARFAKYDGTAWYARTFKSDSHQTASAIFFSGVDDDADVWLNGVYLGFHEGYAETFWFDVGEALRNGENELVVAVHDHGGPGGIYKPVALVPKDSLEYYIRTPESQQFARPSPTWVKDGVIYEVFVRDFSREGTFKSLEEHLPELRKLGVTILWLMPITPIGEMRRKGTLGSPYAVKDYMAIDSSYGSLGDFQEFLEAAHKEGMHVIIDLVINHTAWDNVLLRDHPEWYTHDAQGNIISPNQDWTDVADLNYDSPALRQWMIKMMKHWIYDVGVDGFRCDVAELVPTEFWNAARSAIDSIKPVFMLSEGALPEHHLHAFDMTYSWNLYDALVKTIRSGSPAFSVTDVLRTESLRYPKGSLRMRFVENHDKPRATTVFGYAGSKAAAVIAWTVPGVPLIYNGQEVGDTTRLSLFEKDTIRWNNSFASDFRSFYEELDDLRRRHAALREGDFQILENTAPRSIVAFRREMNSERIVVAANLSNQEINASVLLPEKDKIRHFLKLSILLASADSRIAVKDSSFSLSFSLPPFGYCIAKID